MIFDHLKLVRRDARELARFRAYLNRLQGGHAEAMVVEHEHDDSCCRAESWPTTLGQVLPEDMRSLVIET
jgi:hypothetical protein